MYKLSDNPPQRFPEGRPLEDDLGRWVVVRLKSRHEKSFAAEMTQRGIGYFLPLYLKRTLRKDNGKPRKSVNPLFPGYVAAAPDPEGFRFIAGNPHTAGVLKVVDQPRLVRELSQVERLLSGNAELRHHADLEPGAPVTVTGGSLTGMTGSIVRKGNETRFLVSIQMFGQAVSVGIDESYLKPAG